MRFIKDLLNFAKIFLSKQRKLKFREEDHVSIWYFRESWTIRIKIAPENNLQRVYAFFFPPVNSFLKLNLI